MGNTNTVESAVRDRIRALIAKKGVPDQEVSRSIGKSKSYISNILSGRNNPSIDALYCLCEYFNVTPKDFFDFEIGNPAADRAVITELKRLLGARYELLPDILRSLTMEDISILFKAYQVLEKIHRK